MDPISALGRPSASYSYALREQAQISLPVEAQWLLSLLEEGSLPQAAQPQGKGEFRTATIDDLLVSARAHSSQRKVFGEQQVARWVKKVGAEKRHTKMRNLWDFPPLQGARAKFDSEYGPQKWCEPNEWRAPPSQTRKKLAEK